LPTPLSMYHEKRESSQREATSKNFFTINLDIFSIHSNLVLLGNIMVKYFRQNRKELALGISHKTTPSTSTQKVMNPEPQMHAGIKENVQHTFERLKCCITRHQQRLTTAPKNM